MDGIPSHHHCEHEGCCLTATAQGLELVPCDEKHDYICVGGSTNASALNDKIAKMYMSDFFQAVATTTLTMDVSYLSVGNRAASFSRDFAAAIKRATNSTAVTVDSTAAGSYVVSYTASLSPKVKDDAAASSTTKTLSTNTMGALGTSFTGSYGITGASTKVSLQKVSPPGTGGDSDDKKKKLALGLGIGLGVGIGLPVVVLIAFFAFKSTRKSDKTAPES